MHDISFTFFSALGFVLVFLPLPLHIRARNASTIFNIIWLALGNLVYCVGSIVWWDNSAIVAPVWCDIVCKILIGIQPALAGISLCINRRLALIASSKTVIVGRREKRITLAIDTFFGLLFPLILMAASYVVQPHRFNVVDGVGCQFSEWPSIAAIFLIHVWPVFLGCVSAIYGVCALVIAVRFFLSQRLQFQSLLKTSSSGLDVSQYLRLMGVAMSVLVLGLPLTIYYLVSVALTTQPWTRWDEIHEEWGFIAVYPESSYLVSNEASIVLLLPRWLFPLLSLIFFLTFGVAEDAVGEYARWLRKVTSLLRLPKRQSSTSTTFRPQLGTAVSNLTGRSYEDDISIKESDVDRSLPSSSPTVKGQAVPGQRGIDVLVHVDRDVV